MIRIAKGLALVAALLILPTLTLPETAHALSVQIVDVSGAGAGGTLQVGETVTFDLVIQNETAEDLYGVEVNIENYDLPGITDEHDLGLALQSGQTVDTVFAQANVPSLGLVGGRDNLIDPFEEFVTNNLNPVAVRTVVFRGVDTGSINGTGAIDVGLGGNTIGAGPVFGDVHFQVTFLAVDVADSNAVNHIDLQFIINGVTDGGALVPSTGDSFALTVIPEPGTALLMGLGLAGLATSRRR